MERARVIEVKGDKAVIVVEGGDACASCSAKHVCLSLGGTSKQLTIDNTLSARQDDIVEFTIDERGVVLSSVIVYLTPLLALIAGIVAGSRFHADFGLDGDAAGALGGLAGVGVALVVIRLLTPLLKNKTVFVPRMISIAVRQNTGKI